MKLYVIKGYEFYGNPVEFVIMAKNMNEAISNFTYYANEEFSNFADINSPSVVIDEIKGKIYQIFLS